MMKPGTDHRIYFGRQWQELLAYGTDSRTRESYVATVEVVLPDEAAERPIERVGAPSHGLFIETMQPVPARIVDLHVRTGSREDGVQVEHVSGPDAIAARVGGSGSGHD